MSAAARLGSWRPGGGEAGQSWLRTGGSRCLSPPPRRPRFARPSESETKEFSSLWNHGYVYVDCSPSGMPRAQYSPKTRDHVISKLIEYGNIKEVTVPIPVFFTHR